MDEKPTYDYDAHHAECQIVKNTVNAINAEINEEYKVSAEDLPKEFVELIKKLVEKTKENPPWWSRVDGYTYFDDGEGGYYKMKCIDPENVPDYVWE